MYQHQITIFSVIRKKDPNGFNWIVTNQLNLCIKQVLYWLDQSHDPGLLYMSWRPCNNKILVTIRLATVGCDSTVAIQEHLQLPGLCAGFLWDSDGDVLWDDELICIIWSKLNCLLVVGTQKGNLVM